MNYLQQFKKFKPTPANILKVIGFTVIALIILSFTLSFLNSSLGSVGVNLKSGGSFGIAPQGIPGITTDGDDGFFAEEEAVRAESSIGLPPIIPPEPNSTGTDAEEFEVTTYNATIETRSLSHTCGAIADLKPLEYVIFENVSENERSCNFTFKVAKDRVNEVLAVIENLDPRDLSENTFTIKRSLENLESESDILRRKLEVITETLEDAERSYTEITLLATRNQDAESLAKIIDSKIQTIDRLTRDKISTTAQLERIAKAQADQLDRLDFAVFHVVAFENKFINGNDIKDSWKQATRDAVRDVNRALQDMTVTLVALIFVVLQFALYLLLLLIAVKFGWRIGRYIWKK